MTALANAQDGFSDRDYQVRGVHRVVAGLASGGRGQLRAACGTGKTKMAMWSAHQLVRHGDIVVIACPTVTLVGQTLREWSVGGTPIRTLAVCSDDTVHDDTFHNTFHDTLHHDTGHIDIVEDDSVSTAAALGGPVSGSVTTDPDVVDAWLRQRTPNAVQVIVGTHRSAHVIGEGLQKADLTAALLIVDEAHRTAGGRDKRAALLHDDDVLPAHRRLYMTATPRICLPRGENTDDGDENGDDAAESANGGAVFSMDDAAVFGPVLFTYPFSEAIDDGWLDDYRLAVIGVTQAEVLAVLRSASERARPHATLPSEHAAMVQAAIARAAAQLDLRRVLAFCPLVADAKRFASTFPTTIDALPAQARPRRPLHAAHVDGRMTQAQRRAVLAALTDPPDDGWTVISNAKCLAEGIDVPTIDTVAFTAPKKSTIDIVQAIGRALRRDPDGSGTATIIVPIVLPDSPTDEQPDLDVGEFTTLWQVASALRAHDDRLDHALTPTHAAKTHNPGSQLGRVELMLPAGYDTPSFLEHLTVHMVQATSAKWWQGYLHLVEFHARQGHVRVSTRYTTPTGYRLGSWLSNARRAHAQRRLTPERVTALRELGVELVADMRDAAWERCFTVAERFYRDNGHLRPPAGFTDQDVDLSAWLMSQRKARNRMRADRVERLNSIGMLWQLKPSRWDENLDELVEQLRAFHTQHGRLPRERDHTPLVHVIRQLRVARRHGKLATDVIAALDDLGMNWNTTGAKTGPEWWTGYEHLVAFHQKTGHTRVRSSHVTDDGYPLGYWAAKTRSAYRAGGLPPERTEALDRLGFVIDLADANWEHAFTVAQQFHADHGHLQVPSDHESDGVKLHSWLRSQRQLHAAGTLTKERAKRLSALGVNLTRTAPRSTWEERLAELRAFHAETGTLPTQLAHRRLGSLLSRMRTARRRGNLDQHLVAALDELGMQWEPGDDTWAAGLAAATRYHRRHGHLDVRRSDPRDPADADLDLAHWVRTQRIYRNRGHLPTERIAQLDALGMIWNIPEAAWEDNYTACKDFYATNGTLRGIGNHTVTNRRGEPLNLPNWLSHQRRIRETLSTSKVQRLNAIGMDWRTTDEIWEENYTACAKFYAQHGTLNGIAAWRFVNSVGETPDLVAWLAYNRQRRDKLDTPQIERLNSIGMNWGKKRARR